MKYQKPEIVPLGQATELILGLKVIHLEPRFPLVQNGAADSELDD